MVKYKTHTMSYKYLPRSTQSSQRVLSEKEFKSIDNDSSIMLTGILAHDHNLSCLKRSYSTYGFPKEHYDPFFVNCKKFIKHVITKRFSDITVEQLQECDELLSPTRSTFKTILKYLYSSNYERISLFLNHHYDMLSWFKSEKLLNLPSQFTEIEHLRKLVVKLFKESPQKKF